MLLNGKYVSVLQKGEGDDVLLLHGFMSCKESFYYQINFLSKFVKVTAPDILGFGHSAALDKAYSVGDYAEWLKDFMTAANLKRPVIICHSFGARVALKLLAEDGDIAKKLIITGGAGIVKERSTGYILRVKSYRLVKKVFPNFAEKHFGSKEYRTLSPIMKESYKKIVNEDLKACALAVKVPTLLVYGRDDDVTPPDGEGAIFHNLIEGSKLVIMDGGHFCFCQHPEEFNKTIKDFILER